MSGLFLSLCERAFLKRFIWKNIKKEMNVSWIVKWGFRFKGASSGLWRPLVASALPFGLEWSGATFSAQSTKRCREIRLFVWWLLVMSSSDSWRKFSAGIFHSEYSSYCQNKNRVHFHNGRRVHKHAKHFSKQTPHNQHKHMAWNHDIVIHYHDFHSSFSFAWMPLSYFNYSNIAVQCSCGVGIWSRASCMQKLS